MLKLDVESVAELLKLTVVPSCQSLSQMLGIRVALSELELKETTAKKVQEFVKIPCVVLCVQLLRGQKHSRQLFFLPEHIIRTGAACIMGSEEPEQDVDDIMLGTVAEVVSQSLESSSEALKEYLGSEIKGEILSIERIQSKAQILSWYEKLQNGEVLLASWRLQMGQMDENVYGIIPDEILEIYGADTNVESAEIPSYDGHRGTRIGTVAVSDVCFPEFKVKEFTETADDIDEERVTTREIPLGIAVRIGSTECKVKEILDLEVGQVLMLDKQAGSPADIVVNGELIAMGDVMVSGEHFAARITEILNRKG